MQAEYIQPFAIFVREIQVHFLIGVWRRGRRCLNSLLQRPAGGFITTQTQGKSFLT